MNTTTERDPRDFDCCAYVSKSGKTTCGALRSYHDNPVHQKRHKFVEPERRLADLEIANMKVARLIEVLTAIKNDAAQQRINYRRNEPLASIFQNIEEWVDAALKSDE